MNKFIFIILLVIILIVIYFLTKLIINKNQELFQTEQESNQNSNQNLETQQYTLFIFFSLIVLCLFCSVIYYFSTNTPISELIQKKQLEQLATSNTSDSSKPYIIIVQPSIVPVNQTQPNSSNVVYPYNIVNSNT